MKLSSNMKLVDILALEDSREKLELLRKKATRLWEGQNLWKCEREIARLAEMFQNS